MLPNRLFFTGVPGSRWSGIAQLLECLSGVNTSDQSPDREYTHHDFTGHRGSYFGPKMEFTHEIELMSELEREIHLDRPWMTTEGMKILKSHEWAYKLPFIKEHFPTDWIMLVYRPDFSSYTWWLQAGGFEIPYPNYQAYESPEKMYSEIMFQNKKILEFAHDMNSPWCKFSSEWVKRTFGQDIEINIHVKDILVTVIK